ncbi:hypothetical protein I3842_05G073100 [Carya illinoinensis]|uniref:NAD(P)H-quinone oxidoreductase subunit 5, chloroplastic n=1 Tax=Carya illinoinensis TaxID=32201 RepID=A0A922F069_CARIL|nr:hypothetical protein I3842_05G073100 [Carya illinoinensis]
MIAFSTAGLTAFYMFRIYLLTFEGSLNVNFQNYSDKEGKKIIKKYFRISFLGKKTYPIDTNIRKMTRPFITIAHFDIKNTFLYPHESDSTMLFPMLVLGIFTLFVGAIGIPMNQQGMDFDILSKLLTPAIIYQNSNNSVDWYEFVTNATSFLYKSVYSSLQNLNFRNSFLKNVFYAISLNNGIRGLAQLTDFFDKRVIEGTTNGVGITSFFAGEGIKYIGGGRISSFLLLYLFYVFILIF